MRQEAAPQGAAKPAEAQGPDHVIVLLDKVAKNSSRRSAQGRNSRGKDVSLKAAPMNDVQEKNPPVREVPSKDVQERNLRGKDVRGNGTSENDFRPKQPPRKKEVLGKSFFLRKVQQERKKKLRVAQSLKQNWRKTTPASLAISLLVALTIGVGVYQAYNTWPDMFKSAEDLPATTSTNIGGPTLVSPRFEALRYYLEIAPSNGAAGQKGLRATGMSPLAGGAKFKFHFKPTEGGYIYIIAMGKNGVPQTFLTPRPMPLSGVTTNRSDAGDDFSFPDGEQWFMMQKDAESTPFIIIFSKTPLKTPAFLSSQAGRDLSSGERQALMDLRKRYAANKPEMVAMKNGNQPFISVQSPERAANEPIIFDVSIKRQ
jgi:hypothetical protein